MKRAIIFLSTVIFFNSHGMENVLESAICLAPPYIISEMSENNPPEDWESLKNIWRFCKHWVASHVPSGRVSQEDPKTESAASDTFS